MTGPESRHLVVGRLRKPHGLKGDCAVFPLTDSPDAAFAPGREVWIRSLAGEVVAGPVAIARSRSYHREWLLAFRGYEAIEAIEPWRGHFLEAEAAALPPPEEGELYLHEMEGLAVQTKDGTPLGLVTRTVEAPSGLMLEVQGPKREWLMPYRKEFVVTVDREGRKLVVDLPEGLADL